MQQAPTERGFFMPVIFRIVGERSALINSFVNYFLLSSSRMIRLSRFSVVENTDGGSLLMESRNLLLISAFKLSPDAVDAFVIASYTSGDNLKVILAFGLRFSISGKNTPLLLSGKLDTTIDVL